MLDKLCLSVCSSGYHEEFGQCIKDNNVTPISNTVIESQSLVLSGKNIIVTTTLTNNVDPSNTNLDFYLLNLDTNVTTHLNAVKSLLSSSTNKLQAILSNTVTYSLIIPSNVPLKNTILLTSINGNFNSSIYFNGHSIFNFLNYDYINDPLVGLQYVGLSFTILITIFGIITKVKGHFIA
jgi:hypothetical protein